MLEPQRDFDFCLISDANLSVPNAFAYLNIKVVKLSSVETYNTMKETHLPRSAYLRLWAASLLQGTYDRLIYMDADMFVEAAGFSRLLDADLQGRAIGAVLDLQQWNRPSKHVEEFKLAGRPATPYFNSGFLLIDVETYVENGVLEEALDLADKHPDWILHHDQTLLNLAVNGEWVALSPAWNWQWPVKFPIFSDWLDVRVHHFISGRKPWADPTHLAPRRFQLAYEAFFAAFFPQLPAPIVPSAEPLRSPRRVAKLLVRFLMARSRAVRLMAQYPTPFDTKLLKDD